MKHTNKQLIHLVKPVIKLFHTYILNSSKHVITLKHVIQDITEKPCPQQHNGIDCGLFAVAVSLHTCYLEGNKINGTTSTQTHKLKMRSILPLILTK